GVRIARREGSTRPLPRRRPYAVLAVLTSLLVLGGSTAEERQRSEKKEATRTYENKLTRLDKPGPLLADHPDFVEPIREKERFEAPVLVDDDGADLDVRAWRFCYNARGIIQMPN